MFKRFKRFIKNYLLKLYKEDIQLSKGEAFVKAWLNFNNVSYVPQYHIKVPTFIRKSGNCYADFMVYIHGKRYIIEYNGRQHYEFTPHFHKTPKQFNAQLNRDRYIKAWCKENNVIFVEIPYYLSSKEVIDELETLL